MGGGDGDGCCCCSEQRKQSGRRTRRMRKEGRGVASAWTVVLIAGLSLLTVQTALGSGIHGRGSFDYDNDNNNNDERSPCTEKPPSMADVFESEQFAVAMFAAGCIGAVGVLPLLVLPFHVYKEHTAQSSLLLRFMLGASCGGLLANTCFHILPESFGMMDDQLLFGRLSPAGASMFIGIVSFFLLEKAAAAVEQLRHSTHTKAGTKAATMTKNSTKGGSAEKTRAGNAVNAVNAAVHRRAVFYLNIIVNGLDNVMHGAAISAAFCASFKGGFLYIALASLLPDLCDDDSSGLANSFRCLWLADLLSVLAGAAVVAFTLDAPMH
ncbi:hypothetical protein PTSG_13206 [Salpingoeca rosetta]|uniref:Uncharacterized protein n=1 Tax=Salpingoeca rosetta (strain ATCC 50818 / BSB-021) TaxID=946362 RepID=F2UTH0_SALR5|nr:uncharacterized protein PTSG_13206 [Salpingoeca rosetta]EGD83277.1 hypothetical protein PTSG_13206 [Salpingoeca rosetta]|eukprot:XP_004987533.1 hypothetical protein PTSG_13206 [Salpingoeca rosetta]